MSIVLNGTTGITFPASNTPSFTSYQGGVITSGTTVASTSGTSIDFTSIPSWVKRITVMFTGVSTNGTSNLLVQMGTGSTTYTTTGYLGTCSYVATASAASTQMSTGFMVVNNMVAADLYGGVVTLSLINASTNTWGISGNLGRSTSTVAFFCGGTIPLAAALTAVRITTVNGTDTFDAGSINILYE